MSTDAWDDIPNTSGPFVKWENPGDSIIGTVTGIGTGTDMNGNTVPEITLTTDDGDDAILSASQAQLKAKLFDLRPQVGDRLSVVFTSLEKRALGSLKCFDVAVKPGNGNGGGGKTETPTGLGSETGRKTSASDLL